VPLPVYRGDARAWCWIGDTARAIRVVLERGEEGIYNVGRDDEPVPTIEAARLACRLTGKSEDLIEEVDSPGQSVRIAADKLRALGWEPEVDLETGMRHLLVPEAIPAAHVDA